MTNSEYVVVILNATAGDTYVVSVLGPFARQDIARAVAKAYVKASVHMVEKP